ncbi:hypothetical Protein pso3_08970 [Candidatus Phytoplasma solani]
MYLLICCFPVACFTTFLHQNQLTKLFFENPLIPYDKKS